MSRENLRNAFDDWFEAYREKQMGCYGSGEPTADDPIQDSPSPDATGRSQKEGAVSGCIPSTYGDAAGACLTASVGFEAIRRDSVPTAPPAPNMEAMILAQTRMLLSRSLAYVGLADLKCARQLAVEIRDHLEAIEAYAFSRGIAWEVAAAMVNLMGTAKA